MNGVENNYQTFQGQELTEDLGLNVLEFKWRMHDPAIGRFWQIDPLAEDYVYNSTYAFAENRVIDGFELEGLEWVDVDENGEQYTVYDPSLNDGEGGYTDKATDKHKKLGNDLSQTKKGKEQFDKLVNSTKPIFTVVNNDSEIVLDENGKPVPAETTVKGYTKTNDKGEPTVNIISSEIVFNTETIKSEMEKKYNKEGSSSAYKGLSFDEMMSVVFGHEIDHTTIGNVTIMVNGGDKEKGPIKTAEKIAKQIKRNNKKKKKTN